MVPPRASGIRIEQRVGSNRADIDARRSSGSVRSTGYPCAPPPPVVHDQTDDIRRGPSEHMFPTRVPRGWSIAASSRDGSSCGPTRGCRHSPIRAPSGYSVPTCLSRRSLPDPAPVPGLTWGNTRGWALTALDGLPTVSAYVARRDLASIGGPGRVPRGTSDGNGPRRSPGPVAVVIGSAVALDHDATAGLASLTSARQSLHPGDQVVDRLALEHIHRLQAL